MQDKSTNSKRGDCQEEQTEGKVEVLKGGGKPIKRLWISVDIRFADNHYLVSFNHDSRRVFHNMEELLLAVHAECEKLKP